jgi:hypothetical protein
MIPEAQHTISLLDKPCRPSTILLALHGMLSAVKLDNETSMYATEIDDKRTDRVLASKLCPCALPSA